MQSILGRIALALVLAISATGAVYAWLYQRSGLGVINSQQGLLMVEKLLTENRDLELIEWQPRAELIRTRHRSSGHEVLFTYRDVSGGRTAVGADEYPIDHQAGWNAPPWVPVYPGAHVMASKRDGGGGELLLAVAGKQNKVLAFYQTAIRAEAMNVAVERLGDDESLLRGISRDGRCRLIAKLTGRREATQVRIEYQGQ